MEAAETTNPSSHGTLPVDEKLTQFVDHARDKGMDHATIRQLLLSAGWKDRDVAEVFCARDLELPIPQPSAAGLAPARRRPTTPRKARDACLHLLMFGSLYAWATGLILLLFTYLDFAFPDPAWRTTYAAVQAGLSSVRAALAVVVVAFPVFLIVWNFMLLEVRRHPETAKGVLRRWLGYLSLLVGAIVLSGDAITLIYFLLEGQLTVRFVLKAVVLFLIAGGLVGYLTFTLRSEARMEADR